jgi:hypothetical protein
MKSVGIWDIHGVWDEKLLGVGTGEGISNTESPIKIGGVTKSEGYMG